MSIETGIEESSKREPDCPEPIALVQGLYGTATVFGRAFEMIARNARKNLSRRWQNHRTDNPTVTLAVLDLTTGMIREGYQSLKNRQTSISQSSAQAQGHKPDSIKRI